jgi:2,3-diketo-5-methylthiopentyl-1-phosphate enolase
MYNPIAYRIPEALSDGDYVVATYLYQTKAKVNIHKLAYALSEEQSSGTWLNLPGETDTVLKRHIGRVISIWEVPDYECSVPETVTERTWIIQIGYPVHNFGAQLPLMLTTVHGNVSAAGRLKLIDLTFPEAYTKEFKGPKFGIQGVRDRLGVQNRPLVHTMIKPSIGLTPEQSAEAFYQAALGGIDAVKDDELVVSHPWSDYLDRVKLHTEAADKAFEETGEKTLYFVNVTDRPDRMVERAKRAIDAGATALMVNYNTVGFSALSMLADDPDIDVPLLGHLDFAGAMYGSPWVGLSSHLVLGKLARLAGADIVVYPSSYGKFPLLSSKHLRIVTALTDNFHNIKPSWPMPGGGVHPGMVHLLFHDMGKDFMVGAGGAVHGHPMGPQSGAKALRQAVDAALAGMPVSQYAQGKPELQAALDAWGISQENVKGPFDLMDS